MIACVVEDSDGGGPRAFLVDLSRFDESDAPQRKYLDAIRKAMADKKFGIANLDWGGEVALGYGDALRRVVVQPPCMVEAMVTICLIDEPLDPAAEDYDDVK